MGRERWGTVGKGGVCVMGCEGVKWRSSEEDWFGWVEGRHVGTAICEKNEASTRMEITPTAKRKVEQRPISE